MNRVDATAGQGISDQLITALDSRLAGDVVHSRHHDYQRERRIWNYMIDRHPAVVARCAADADVATAIEFAREHALPLAVRGGGHSVTGHSVVETVSSWTTTTACEKPIETASTSGWPRSRRSTTPTISSATTRTSCWRN